MQVRTNPPTAKTMGLSIIALSAAMGLFYYQGVSDLAFWTLFGAYILIFLGSLYKGL